MLRVAFVFCLAYLLLPETAFAHSAAPGIEGFYSGFLHPFREVAQGLTIAALGLLAGQQPKPQLDKVAVAYVLATIVGLIAALISRGLMVPDPVFFLLTMITGLFVAVSRRLGAVLLLLLACTTGIASGMISAPDPGSWSAMAFTISGSLLSAIVIFIYALVAANWSISQANRPWLAIGLRVLGSWIAAACALMLALAVRA